MFELDIYLYACTDTYSICNSNTREREREREIDEERVSTWVCARVDLFDQFLPPEVCERSRRLYLGRGLAEETTGRRRRRRRRFLLPLWLPLSHLAVIVFASCLSQPLS